jgi:chorismate synthase
MDKVNGFMARRAPGGSELSTARRESDVPRIIAGLNDEGFTCGAPLCAVIDNADARSSDYSQLKDMPRPGHSDYTAFMKYHGFNDIRGGGQFSGRLTAPLCFAGAVCIQLLAEKNIIISSHIASIGQVIDEMFNPVKIDAGIIEGLSKKAFATLSDSAGELMKKEILSAKEEGDSVGGVIEACALNLPAGLGEPMFDGMENRISSAVFAIPGLRD